MAKHMAAGFATEEEFDRHIANDMFRKLGKALEDNYKVVVKTNQDDFTEYDLRLYVVKPE